MLGSRLAKESARELELALGGTSDELTRLVIDGLEDINS